MLRLFVLTLLLVVCCTPSVKSWVRTLMRRQVARCAAPSWCFPSRPKPRTKQECCSHQRSHQDIFIVITVRIASHADILLAHQATSPDLPKRLLAKRMSAQETKKQNKITTLLTNTNYCADLF